MTAQAPDSNQTIDFTRHAQRGHNGFLDLGFGLALLAVFGAVSWAIVSAGNAEEETAGKEQFHSSTHVTYVCQQANPECSESKTKGKAHDKYYDK